MVARLDELGSPRILAGVPGTIALTPYLDGAAAVGTPTALSCSVAGEDGTVIATPAVTWSTPKLLANLTAVQNSRPRVLVATWSFTSGGEAYTVERRYEAVGEFLFTEVEARAYSDAALADADGYPTERILRARDEVQDAFGDIIGAAVGLRGRRMVVDGCGGRELLVPLMLTRRVRAVSERTWGTQTWTAYSTDDLADILVSLWGRFERESRGSFLAGRQNVALEVEHGITPIPEELRRAALHVVTNRLPPSDIDDRATSESGQFGTFSLATAGRDRQWYGLPLVDSILGQWRDKLRVPGVG